MKIVNKIKHVAMEFLDAKKPLTVEKRPVKARKSMGRPIRGVRKTSSEVLFQLKNGTRAVLILLK